jgi:3-hydroxyanthranilate 3,4-dioxygenase
MPLERKKTLNVFKEAKNTWGSYDEFPVGPKGTDPMPYLSRNRVAQPFFLVSDEDQVLIQMSGTGVIDFKDLEPSRMQLATGDTVYIPACVPSRVLPDGENLQIRLRAEPPAREAAAFYCDTCGALAHTTELTEQPRQTAYQRAVDAWNSDTKLRTCPNGHVSAKADLGDIAWPAVAAAILAED